MDYSGILLDFFLNGLIALFWPDGISQAGLIQIVDVVSLFDPSTIED